MKDKKIKFGDALYKAINENAMNYDSVAKLIGLKDSRQIYCYVNGEKWPSQLRLIMLIHHFNLNLEEILN